MIRVVLAEDQALVRAALEAMLATIAGVTLLEAVADGAAAIDAVTRLRPDVLLLDMRMPRGDGLSVLRTLAGGRHLPPTVILTTFDDAASHWAAWQAGAAAILLKDVTPASLGETLRRVATGERIGPPPEGAGRVAAPLQLAGRELKLLRLLASGLDNQVIGDAMGWTAASVRTECCHLFRKLGVHDRISAVLRALETGLL